MLSLFPHGFSHYLIGGLLIGSGVALLYFLSGKVGGMSTFFSAAWSWICRHPGFQQASLTNSRTWRLAYAIGLILGAALCTQFVDLGALAPDFPLQTTLSPVILLAGGFLVGFGARLGKGCTSGHGICGMASLQWPSLLAVLTFLGTAFVTVWIVGKVMT